MGKFRPRVKGQSKGKRWSKGQASSSNPKTSKYRDIAKSRFFHENLGDTGLTIEAVQKHEAFTTYGHSPSKAAKESVHSIAASMEDMTVDDEGAEGSDAGTFATFKTFASNWSTCSNLSFSKLLNKFDSKIALHKEMLAILAAVTEVLKEQGGKESTTEYFLALIETLKSTEAEDGATATISLIAMGIKSVPQPILRKQFSDCANVFIKILELYADTSNAALMRALLGCLSVLLRAQEYAVWSEPFTLKVFDSVLAFATHSKPKIRKAAQHAVCAILRGSCFIIPSEDMKTKVVRVHPAGSRVAASCVSQLGPQALLGGARGTLHVLTLLKDVIAVFSKDDIKTSCECLLSLMSHNNVVIKTCCLHCLHSLFSAERQHCNLSAQLAGQVARALATMRPSASDSGQILAWTAVMQQAYVCLANLDSKMCLPILPSFVSTCANELWQSDVPEVNAAGTNALKALILDCVKPSVESEECFNSYKKHIEAIFKTIGTGLDNPFNQAIKQVIITIATCFEIGNERIVPMLAPLLKQLNERRESHNFHNHKEVEYAIGCAIKSLGPEMVLQCIPLRSSPEEMNLDRSWLLPVLKDKIQNSTLKLFALDFLDMASLCRRKSREYKENNQIPLSHTYELLCSQVWAIFPSFCNSPMDIVVSFKAIAKVLGNVLKDNPEYRLSVMQGLRKLINCAVNNEKTEDLEELARFAKNFIPLLLNIYMTPAKDSAAKGQRLAAFETIQVYLVITTQELREELFVNSLQQLTAAKDDHFQKESLLDIVRLLILYQEESKITELFEKWVYPLCKTRIKPLKIKYTHKRKKTSENGDESTSAQTTEDDVRTLKTKYKQRVTMAEMEFKKAYRMLEEIFKCDKENCKQFLSVNKEKIKKMLTASRNKVANSCQATRLRCIQYLLEMTPNICSEDKLVQLATATAVMGTRDINSHCRTVAFQLLAAIGNLLKTTDKGLKGYTDIILSGLDGTPHLAAASLRSMASAVFHFAEELGLERLQHLLERCCALLLSPNREIVTACYSFLKVYTKMIPTPVLSGSLPLIFQSLSGMSEDSKRHLRIEVGYFLSRMLRKFDYEMIDQLIPETDEIMHKRLRNLRKLETRKQKYKDTKDSQDQDLESEFSVKGTSKTLEDLLKDSDSEMELDDDTETKNNNKKAHKKDKTRNKAWIQDDPDNIVDLADISAAQKITATDPNLKKKKDILETEAKKKDSVFKTASDGRLMISEIGNAGSDDDDKGKHSSSSSDEDSDDESGMKSAKLLKRAGTKRKLDDLLSTRSGRSGRTQSSFATSKYQAGGKGIHRPIKQSAPSVSSHVGSEYRSRKAKGDFKKKGKPDPYAYVPMSRKTLNKRKHKPSSKVFKGVVKTKSRGISKNKTRQKVK